MNEVITLRTAVPKWQELADEQKISAADDLSKIASVVYGASRNFTRPEAGEIDRAVDCASQAIKSGAVKHLSSWIEAAREPASRKEVIDAVSVLVGSNPRPAQDLAVYGRMLCQDVIAAGPTRIALHDALSLLRRTSEYLPTIAATLQALEASEARFCRIDRMLKELPEALPKVQERRQAEAKLLADRVRAFERRRDEREAHILTVANDPDWDQKTADQAPDWTLNRDLKAFRDGGVEGFRLNYDRTRNHPEGWR